eukprot:TRINITY_DN1209_c0_g2_i3.p1 TRINITY_DN1209_c0_g2~~TRINITY_DN1209_c0_g2_i3.p1  ORF type:complete len:867 (+),score=207.38 TRINITY_DN1209_c0_g2_i3:45-2603(+)
MGAAALSGDGSPAASPLAAGSASSRQALPTADTRDAVAFLTERGRSSQRGGAGGSGAGAGADKAAGAGVKVTAGDDGNLGTAYVFRDCLSVHAPDVAAAEATSPGDRSNDCRETAAAQPPSPSSAQSRSREMASCQRVLLLMALWLGAVYCWIQGAFLLPTLEVHVMPGTPFTSFYRRSLVLTLLDLYNKRTYFACATLTVFSVIVPASKLIFTVYFILKLFTATPSEIYGTSARSLRWLSRLASYQLLDLYVGVLFVVHFNSDSADARFLTGFYWYYAYCMTSMCMSVVLDGAFATEEALECQRIASRQNEHSRVQAEEAKEQPQGSALDALSAGIRRMLGYAAQESPARSSVTRGEAEEESEPLRRVPAFADEAGTLLLSAVFVVLLAAAFWVPLIEVRTVWQGVSVDRSIHTLAEIFFSFLPSNAGPLIAIPLLLMNLLIPLCYVAAQLATLAARRATLAASDPAGMLQTAVADPQRRALTRRRIAASACGVADALRPWATADVLCFAMLVFVFTVQDPKTLTTPVGDAEAYYQWLGAGFALFFLRWLSEGTEKDRRCGSIPTPRFFAVIAAWLAVCFIVSGGVGRVSGAVRGRDEAAAAHRGHGGDDDGHVGSTEHFTFDSLESVCTHVMPVIDKTLRKAVPAAMGECQNSHKPPQPCKGNKPLYETVNGNGFIKAAWVGGINTIRLNVCHLWKDPEYEAAGLAKYHLKLGGHFEKVPLFLHAKQCESALRFLGDGGCTTMHSADHCCGANKHFNVTLGLRCKVPTGFDAIELEKVAIDELLVMTDFLGGSLRVKALDIAPTVMGLLGKETTKFLESAHLMWAGEQMSIPQLINHLIAYNSPGSVGMC